MAFMRSPVRSRSGPPSFARECRRRMPTIARSVTVGLHRPSASFRWQAILRSGSRRRFPQLRLSPLAVGQHDFSILYTFSRSRTCSPPDVPLAKRFVYVLRNQNRPCRYYTGLTSNVEARLAAHNLGHCPHTAGGGLWEVDVVVEFADEERAVAFERYLKSGSGVAFAQRHLRLP
jgi:putative endonuclease